LHPFTIRSFLLALATTLPAMAQAPTDLALGVYSYKKPTDVVREFISVTDWLSARMTQVCERPVTVRLRVFKTYDECLDRFVDGDVDFVRFGPASYALAKQRNAKIELLVAEQEDGKKRCHGVIAVRADSPVRTLTELRGRKFAFGDQNSTIGRFLSQAELVKVGVFAKDLAEYRYLDRHDKVFKAVEVGDFDAGAMHVATFEKLNDRNQLREIARFDNVGKPWVARAGLDAALVTALRSSLLELKDEAVLKALNVHGFLPTNDKDFQLVRDGMKTAGTFDPPIAQPEPGK
jgi:phosphonate transport system substrate-binding protein